MSKTVGRHATPLGAPPLGQRSGALTLLLLLAATCVLAAMVVHLFLVETDWERIGSLSEILSLIAAFVPDPSFVPEILKPLLDTLLIAFWGTLLAVVMSVPVAFMAARNLTPYAPVTYPLGRGIIVLSRSVHEIIFALVFVSALGLGPLPGVLALAFRSLGFMGKTTAEAIENLDRGPVEAVISTGAGRLSVFLFGVVPQVFPIFIGNAIFQLDINFRRAAILGLVGAGGIGIQFTEQMLAFNYDRAGTIVVAVVLTVTLGEILSNRVRERFLRGPS